MTEGGGDSSHHLVDVLDLAKNSISMSGLKDVQVCSRKNLIKVVLIIM